MRIFEVIKSNIDVAVFYGGRFQPMHKGHFGLYQSLKDKFGPNNVFIATTFGKKQQQAHAVGDFSTDPFTFEEKQFIINTMYGIPSEHIVNTQPYRPDMSLVGLDKEKNALILAFSDKDAGRLKPGNVLRNYEPGMALEPNFVDGKEHRAYIYTSALFHGGANASDFRSGMRNLESEDARKELFVHYFGIMNDAVYNLINERLNGGGT